MLPELVKACDNRLSAVLDEMGPAREMQIRRDAWTAFQKHQTIWLNQTRKALQRTLLPHFSRSTSGPVSTGGRLELVAEGAIDDQIMASRLAMRVLDSSSTELNELRLRIQHLEKRQELPRGDVLLPDVTARLLVDQWLEVGMTREAWQLVQEALVPVLAAQMLEAYKAANAFLVSSGVLKEIDLQSLVRRAPGARSSGGPGAGKPPANEAPAPAAHGPDGGGGSSGGAVTRQAPGRYSAGGQGDAGSGGPTGMASSVMGVHDETRLMTSTTPLARARMRAQGVMGRLKRMLMDKVGGDFEATQLMAPPSPRLQHAMASAVAEAGPLPSGGGLVGGQMGVVHLEQAAAALRHRTTELKQAASTPSWPRNAFRPVCGSGLRGCRFLCCASRWPNPSFSAPCSTPLVA